MRRTDEIIQVTPRQHRSVWTVLVIGDDTMFVTLKQIVVLVIVAVPFVACSAPRPAVPTLSSATVVAPTPSAPAPTQSMSCAITPFGPTPFPEPSLAALPWAKAEPASADIVAHLFAVPDKPLEPSQPLHLGKRKILWQIDNPQRGAQLEILGTNITSGTTFHELFSHADSPAWAYPSEINFATPGCWKLDLKSGDTTAQITLQVGAS